MLILAMHPYLVCNGNGQEAVKFYEDALGAQVLRVQTFGEMPPNPDQPPMSDDVKDRVLNAHLKVGDTDLMISDTFPGQPFQVGDQVTVALIINSKEKSQQVFDKLQVGGQVLMALQETFWSPAYGQVTDKFGVTWQISTYVANDNDNN